MRHRNLTHCQWQDRLGWRREVTSCHVLCLPPTRPVTVAAATNLISPLDDDGLQVSFSYARPSSLDYSSFRDIPSLLAHLVLIRR